VEGTVPRSAENHAQVTHTKWRERCRRMQGNKKNVMMVKGQEKIGRVREKRGMGE
jgi:hypothetical protein